MGSMKGVWELLQVPRLLVLSCLDWEPWLRWIFWWMEEIVTWAVASVSARDRRLLYSCCYIDHCQFASIKSVSTFHSPSSVTWSLRIHILDLQKSPAARPNVKPRCVPHQLTHPTNTFSRNEPSPSSVYPPTITHCSAWSNNPHSHPMPTSHTPTTSTAPKFRVVHPPSKKDTNTVADPIYSPQQQQDEHHPTPNNANYNHNHCTIIPRNVL